MRALWMFVVISICVGCLPRIPRQRLAERAKVAVAYIVDPGYSGKPFTPPEALKKAIATELEDHNLEVIELPLVTLGNQRLTDARFEALRRAAGTPFVLLVEQRVQFFSQLDGRYRWEVGTTLTASRVDGSMARDPFEIPVILMYDHEKENEAIATAAPDIANRVGVLMDGVLAGEATTPRASAKPTGIYFVMVDRFADSDRSNDGNAAPEDPQAYHGGDRPGVIDHLDWIQSLGFDTVWLSPIFKMRTEKWHGYGAFHGYWTWDLAALEPKFGDELLLARLRDELDRRHMKLVLDLVLNHVGPDAPLLQSKPSWFHKRGGVTDWNDATQLVMNDVHGLPDLATEQDEVFEYLLGAARRWLPRRST